MNLLEGGKGGEGRMGERGWGGDGGRGERVGREGGGDVGERGRVGREGGWGEREGEVQYRIKFPILTRYPVLPKSHFLANLNNVQCPCLARL